MNKTAAIAAATLLCAAAPAAAGTGTAEFLATINANGTILRGSGVSTASRLAAGSYAVDFPRAVMTCNVTATAKSVYAFSVSVEATGAKPNRALVRTWSGQAPRDVAFHILVKCQD